MGVVFFIEAGLTRWLLSRLPLACELLRFGDLGGSHVLREDAYFLCRPLVALCRCQVEPHVCSDIILRHAASFETARITELADRFPQLKHPLLAITERIVDLLPVARRYYYHPSQQGSWSIKNVLPAIATDLSYDKLDGVLDGGMAMTAYLEAIHPRTASGRKDEVRQQLLNYCSLDTYALVRLWQYFTGRNDIPI